MSEKTFGVSPGDRGDKAHGLASVARESAPAIEQEIDVLRARLGHLTPPGGYELAIQPLVEAAVRNDQSLGPLPLPQFLREYEEVFPGAAEILFEELRKQGDHRRRIESQVVDRQNRRADRGQNWAGGIAVGALIAAVGGILLGQPAAGVGIFGGTLVSIVLAFLANGGRSVREHEAKSSRIEQSSDSSVEITNRSKRSKSTT